MNTVATFKEQHEYIVKMVQRRAARVKAFVKYIGFEFIKSSDYDAFINLATPANHEALAEALEQFTADEIAEFIITMATEARFSREDRLAARSLRDIASQLRVAMNDIEDEAERMERRRFATPAASDGAADGRESESGEGES